MSWVKEYFISLLVSSLFSNLLGNNLEGSIYLKQSLNFLRPVYFDEIVEAGLTIKNLNPEKSQILLQTRIIKLEKNEIAVDGEALVKYPELRNLL
jgi:3-hydroxybutyryl-CoA dehydratase